MDIQKAKEILGNKADWELKHMQKALSHLSLLNTEEENERLEAIKTYFNHYKFENSIYPSKH